MLKVWLGIGGGQVKRRVLPKRPKGLELTVLVDDFSIDPDLWKRQSHQDAMNLELSLFFLFGGVKGPRSTLCRPWWCSISLPTSERRSQVFGEVPHGGEEHR